MKADLHVHTTCSDGNWSPAQVVTEASKRNLTHLAITDHDTLDGAIEAQKHRPKNMQVIPAVEITCMSPQITLAADPAARTKTMYTGNEIHVLGYFIDLKNKQLHEFLQHQRQERQLHLERTIQAFQEHGHNITMASLSRFAKGASPGRPHLAQALFASGITKSVSDAYALITTPGNPFFQLRQVCSYQEAIFHIHMAGGFASLAHPEPHLYLEELLSHMKNAGLDAVEAYHPRHTDAFKDKLLDLSQQLHLDVSGGSDCHGPFENYPPLLGTMDIPQHKLAWLIKEQVAIL